MKAANKLRQRGGFTLVELSIVIALLGIVVALIATFIVYMSRQERQVEYQSETLLAITDSEAAIKKWVRKYDTIDYYFKDNNGVLEVYDSEGTGIEAERTAKIVARLQFNKSQGLYETEYNADGSVNKVTTVLQTERLEAMRFMMSGVTSTEGTNIVYCDIEFKNPDKKDRNDSIRYMFATFAQNYKDILY